jgi:hypothetical protein
MGLTIPGIPEPARVQPEYRLRQIAPMFPAGRRARRRDIVDCDGGFGADPDADDWSAVYRQCASAVGADTKPRLHCPA